MPARTASQTREIRLRELPVSMTMTGARVGSTTFAIGVVELPDLAPTQRSAALLAMREGMLHNVGAALDTPVLADKVLRDDATAPAVPAQSIDVVGTRTDHDSGQPLRLIGVFAALDERLYQVIVVGPAPDEAPAHQFIESFRLGY